jgi:hypothetical protein
MSSDVVRKREMEKQRIDGTGVVPTIKHAAGGGTEYGQGWKIGTASEIPMGEARPAPKTNALGQAFFRRSNGK